MGVPSPARAVGQVEFLWEGRTHKGGFGEVFSCSLLEAGITQVDSPQPNLSSQIVPLTCFSSEIFLRIMARSA